jgi:hypothetical protein
MSGVQEITELNGEIIVSIPFSSEYDATVWVIGDDGELLPIDSEFDAETKTLTFTTTQLGYFIIGNALPYTPAQHHVLRFSIGSPEYTINDTDRESDAAPFIDPAYNRIMLPVRTLAEGLGAEVNWNSSTRTVYITNGNESISLPLDTPLPDNMGTPTVINGRTFVPARFIAEILGATVNWDDITNSVEIIH